MNIKNNIDLNTKRIIIVMIVVIIALIVVILVPKNDQKIDLITPVQIDNAVVESNITETSSTDKFRQEVPANIVVPDKNTVLTEEQKKEIALPTVVAPAAPGVESNYRSFDIKAEGGKFIPNKIIVNQGDTVHINFTAVDKDYDIIFPSYGMKQIAKIGQTKVLEFQALADGSFLYYCEACGGADSLATGQIIVVKK